MGGLFLAYEAIVKAKELLLSPNINRVDKTEEEAVRGAIKIDFILSFEILLIALSTITDETLLMQLAALISVSLLLLLWFMGWYC